MNGSYEEFKRSATQQTPNAGYNRLATFKKRQFYQTSPRKASVVRTISSSNGAAHDPIAVIGTGLFGTALAERLLADGFPVRVYNRTREKAEPLLARGAKWSDNPLKECQRIIFSLYTTAQVVQVLEQMHSGLEPGQIFWIQARATRIIQPPWGANSPEMASSISKRLFRAQASRRAITKPRH